MEPTFKVKTEKSYVIIGISHQMKCFYAEELHTPSGKDPDIEYFYFLDVSAKDFTLIKKGNKFINRTGYRDYSSGLRERVAAQIEFIEE